MAQEHDRIDDHSNGSLPSGPRSSTPSSASLPSFRSEDDEEDGEPIIQHDNLTRARTTSTLSNSSFHQASSSSKRRGPEKRSPIWKYFDTMGERKELMTRCKLMKQKKNENEAEEPCKWVSKGRNTTNMRIHLNHHPKEKAELEKIEKDAANQPAIPVDATPGSLRQRRLTQCFGISDPISKRDKRPYPTDSPVYQTMKADLARLGACTSFTLSMVDEPLFQILLGHLDQRAGDSLPCRNTLKKWVINYSEKVERQLGSTLQSVRNFFVSLDIWSNRGLDKFYLGVVVIFYNPKTKRIATAALACRDFPHPHTGVRIRLLLEEIFKQNGLHLNQVIRFLTDKGANVVNGLQPFTVVQRVPRVASLYDVDERIRPCGQNFIEIELDIEIEGEDPDDEEFDLDEGALAAIEEFEEDDSPYEETFPKRLSCVAHGLNLVFHKILDGKESAIKETRESVLKLLRRMNSSGVSNQKLTGKKLLKIANTRWNSFFYVLQRLLLLKEAIIEVCRERLWGIEFDWNDIEKYVALMKPLAVATTYLEGDQYPTASSVIPAMLSLEEHFVDTKTKDRSLQPVCDEFFFCLRQRFGQFMDVKHEKFDQTLLMCTMLNPVRSLELNDELYAEGKRRLFDFLKAEIEAGHFFRQTDDSLPPPPQHQQGNEPRHGSLIF